MKNIKQPLAQKFNKSKKLTPLLNCVLVVEGKSDQAVVQALFDVHVITTNGSALNSSTMKLIELASQTNQIILLLDPDYQGKKIMHQILHTLAQCCVCYLTKKDLNPNKAKQGVAEAQITRLHAKILACYQAKTSEKKPNWSWNDYLNLNLHSKSMRLQLCAQLQIPYFNHKQLFKQLQMLKIEWTTLQTFFAYA